MSLLFFSAIDSVQYEMFVIPFVASSLIAHQDAKCEILILNKDQFLVRYQQECEMLYSEFGDRFIFREWPEVYKQNGFLKSTFPGSLIRFLEIPTNIEEYVYISDIDMLFVQPILKTHQALMSETGLPYTNIIRPNSRRLTGCMMVKSAYYQEVSHILDVYKNNLHRLSDEEMLYQIVNKSSIPLPVYNEPQFRPILSIHTSPNRKIFGEIRNGKHFPGWGCETSILKKAALLFNDPRWQRLKMSDEYQREYLSLIQEAVKNVCS